MGRKGQPNNIEVVGEVAYLYIPKGRKAQPRQVMIDVADMKLVSQYRWCTAKTGGKTYVITNIKRHDGGFQTLYLHRLIMAQGEMLKGTKVPDHINGDTMDNRKENLRLVTHEVNTSIGKKTAKRSKYRGVTIRYKKVKGSEDRKRIIVATPRIAKGEIMPITCKTERQAAITYDIASILYFKQNLLLEQLNFPEFLPEYEAFISTLEKTA